MNYYTNIIEYNSKKCNLLFKDKGIQVETQGICNIAD